MADAPRSPKPRRLVFAFDERSLVTRKQLNARGASAMTPAPDRLWTIAEIAAANRAAHRRDAARLAHEIAVYGHGVVVAYLEVAVRRLLAGETEEPRD
jgi:hypothetical protein